MTAKKILKTNGINILSNAGVMLNKDKHLSSSNSKSEENFLMKMEYMSRSCNNIRDEKKKAFSDGRGFVRR